MAVVAKMMCSKSEARGGAVWVACSPDHPDAEPPEAFNGYYGLPPWLRDAVAIRSITGHSSTAVCFTAVSARDEVDDPNRDWASYTPAGELSLTVNNPDLLDHFEVGADYRVTIEKIRKNSSVMSKSR